MRHKSTLCPWQESWNGNLRICRGVQGVDLLLVLQDGIEIGPLLLLFCLRGDSTSKPCQSPINRLVVHGGPITLWPWGQGEEEGRQSCTNSRCKGFKYILYHHSPGIALSTKCSLLEFYLALVQALPIHLHPPRHCTSCI